MIDDDIEFEVVKFCQRSEEVCSGCSTCHNSGSSEEANPPTKKYSTPEMYYTRNFQNSCDEDILNLMLRGLSRNEAVMELGKMDNNNRKDE